MSESEQAVPFSQVLSYLADGAAERNCAERLQEVVAAVLRTGKKGAVNLTITVSPPKRGTNLTIDADVTAKVPVLPPASTFMWGDDDGNLLRRDPAQPDLPGMTAIATAVDADNTVVDVDVNTGEVIQNDS